MALNPPGGVPLNSQGVMWQVIIHCVFVLSAIALAWTDKLMMAGVKAAKSDHEAH